MSEIQNQLFEKFYPKDQYRRSVGYVKLYNGRRGFGFITHDEAKINTSVSDGEDIFFHINEFTREVYPEVGDYVQFSWVISPKGGVRAYRCIVLKRNTTIR